MSESLDRAILASLEGEVDTVTLWRRVSERLEREIPIGTLHAALDRLGDAAAIRTRDGDELVPERGNRPRRYVRITRTGEWMLLENTHE